jgi:toxin ParE1/3/4
MAHSRRIAFSESAIRDLEDVKAWFLSKAALEAGERLVRQIVERAGQLADFPESGLVIPEFDAPWLRELVHPPFRIVYRLDTERARIVRVWRSVRRHSLTLLALLTDRHCVRPYMNARGVYVGPWVSSSRSTLQLIAAACCAVVGAVLMFSFHGFHSVRANAFAGFLLGVLLLIVGLWGLLFAGRQTVTVDPRRHRIDVVDSLLVGRRTRSISFDAVTGINIGYLGKRSNCVRNYYLVLHLIDGKDYPLFAPGRFYEGSSNRGTVEGWREQLEAYLAAGSQG